jgi:hypothetical protein
MQAFDASSMIYAWDNYPVRQFPGLWEWIAGQIAKKILVMPDVALEEVSKEAPECSQWLEENNIKMRDVNNAIIQDAMRIKGLLGIVGDSYHPKGVGKTTSSLLPRHVPMERSWFRTKENRISFPIK